MNFRFSVENSFGEIDSASYGNLNLSLQRSYLAVIVQILKGSLQEFDVSHRAVISENNKSVAAYEQDKRTLSEDVERGKVLKRPEISTNPHRTSGVLISDLPGNSATQWQGFEK